MKNTIISDKDGKMRLTREIEAQVLASVCSVITTGKLEKGWHTLPDKKHKARKFVSDVTGKTYFVFPDFSVCE